MDNALGAVLSLQLDDSSAVEEASGTCTAFVHVSNVSDKRTERLDKALKIGSKVKLLSHSSVFAASHGCC